MGTFVIFWSGISEMFMVRICTALSLNMLKLQSENAGIYVHFEFIYKSTGKIFIYWPIFKMSSSTYSHEIRLSNSRTISIYLNTLKADRH